jgi:hypothetical protein
MFRRVEIRRDLDRRVSGAAWSEPRSSGATTATVSIPSALQALKIRSAISPRFATSSRCIAGL